MFIRLKHLLIVVGLVLPTVAAAASVPSTLGYQGLLSDGGGAPVPNGAYDLHFSLYDVASGGTAVWSESHPGVGVVNGGFAVTLGSVNALTGVAFDGTRWLGIRVGTDPELTPRIELSATPYALGLRTPFRMVSPDTTPALTLGNVEGYRSLRLESWMQMTNPDYGGYLQLQSAPGGNGVVAFGGTGLPSYRAGIEVWMTPSEGEVACALRGMQGEPRAGEMYVRGSMSGRYAWLRGSYLPSQSPLLEMFGSASGFVINTGMVGEGAAILPPNSIGPDEMTGIPGISHTAAGLVTIGSTMGPVVATTITTPREGYIRVTAGGEVRLNGTSGANTVAYQITTNPVAAEDPAVSRGAGAHQYVSTAFQFFTANAERVYFLPAGTHTFYLQARRDAAPGGAAGIKSPSITAAFFPVSYGSVVSTMETGETTDLRTLELRALQARLEAERAARALEVARAKDEVTSMAPSLASTGRGR